MTAGRPVDYRNAKHRSNPVPERIMLDTVAAILHPLVNPVAIQLGPVAVRWYGIAYLTGFFLAYLLLRQAVRRGTLEITHHQLSDLLGWVIIGVIAGGRLGWWLLYHRDDGASEPWFEPIAIWHGGMSFHGGLIGVILALALWSWRQRVSLWQLADAAALVAPIGLFFGRIANFINAELVGRPTTLRWGVIFPGDDFARHPSQLYEAILEGPLLLGVLWLAKCLQRRDGFVAASFLTFYGLFRFVVEFTREPDPQLEFIAFGWMTVGQLLSAILVISGVVLSLIRLDHGSDEKTNLLAGRTATAGAAGGHRHA